MSVWTTKGNASGRNPSGEVTAEVGAFTVVVQSPSTETLKRQTAPTQRTSITNSKRSSSSSSSSSSDKQTRPISQNSSGEARPASRTLTNRPPLPQRQNSSNRDASGFSVGSSASAASTATTEGVVRQGHVGPSCPGDEGLLPQQGWVHTHKPRRQHSHQQLNHSRSFTRASSPSPTNEPSTTRRLAHNSFPVNHIPQHSASMTDLRRQHQHHQHQHPRKHGAKLSAGVGEEFPPRPASSASHHRGYRPQDNMTSPHASRDGSRDGWDDRRGDDAYRTSNDAYSIESYANRSLTGSSLSMTDSHHKGQKTHHQPDYGMGIVETHHWPEEDERSGQRHPHREQQKHQRHSKTRQGARLAGHSDDDDEEDRIASLDIHDLEIAHHDQSMGLIPSAALHVPETPSRPSSALSHTSSQDQSHGRHWASSARPYSPPTLAISTAEPEGGKSAEEVSEKHRDKAPQMAPRESSLEKKTAVAKIPRKSHETKGRAAAATTHQHGAPQPQTQEQQTTFSQTLVGGDSASIAETERTADGHNNYLAPLPPFQQGPAYLRGSRRGRCGRWSRRWWILIAVLVIAIVVVAILTFVLHRIQICLPKHPARADPVEYAIDPAVVPGLVLFYDTQTRGTVRIIDSSNATETRVLLKLQRQFYKLKSDVDQQAVTGFQIITLPNGYLQYTLDDSANQHRQFFVSSVLCSESILTIEMPRTKPGQQELALDATFSYQDVTVMLDESVYRNVSWKFTGTQNQGLIIQSLAVQSLDIVYPGQDSSRSLDLQLVAVAEYLTVMSQGGLIAANIVWYPSLQLLQQQHPTNTSTPTPTPSATPPAADAAAANATVGAVTAAVAVRPLSVSISSLVGDASVQLRRWNVTTQFRVQGGITAQVLRRGQLAGSNSLPGVATSAELTSTSSPGSVSGSFQPHAPGGNGGGAGGGGGGGGGGAGANAGLSLSFPAQVLVMAGDTASLDFV
ncbi:hypothetical protein DFQ27_008059 [Actinomortierella ambigua]|uniref:Uncharacterized protein n=1 Tax=Actinomortierella ambigua TaxID=1343610 RepID=A0A9P6PT76_9FUNG|nr:hypothetical protein DFQ27_008059 [Actinomortierella ambigua]